jgi:hypothetical protein
MVLNSSGNLGLGVTPSAWGGSIKAIEGFSTSGSWSIASGGGLGSALNIQSNAYYDGSNWIYKSTNPAANYYQSAGSHNWRTAASGTAGNAITFTSAMTLDASGNLLVATTNTSPHSSGTYGIALRESVGVLIGVNDSHAIIAARWNGNGEVIRLQRDNTDVGSIDVTTTATSYNTSSDYRLKNTIVPMTGALAKVALLKPCTYKWNANGSDGEGFIAHELAEVCPDAVTGAKDAVDAEGNPQYQGIDTSFLVATLTAAIQELKTEFDAYKASHP